MRGIVQFYILCGLLSVGRALSPNSILFLVRSQRTAPHEITMSNELVKNLVESGVPRQNVFLQHEQPPKQMREAWVPLTWLNGIESGMASRIGMAVPPLPAIKWIFFADSNTRIDDMDGLCNLLSDGGASDDGSKGKFIGHRLQDVQHAIIHHFYMDPKFGFPYASSGYAIDHVLYHRFESYFRTGDNKLPVDTHIDAIFEFARFMQQKFDILMTHEPAFCIEKEQGCVTHRVDRETYRQSHGLKAREVIIAVKTTEKFHVDRVPVIKQTWGQPESSPVEIIYASDTADETIPTIDIGINTERGHCAKTHAILKLFMDQYYATKKWFFIADDDTLLNIPQLLKVLDSYNESHSVYLGERYGYGKTGGGAGYDYVTMGGGVALSKDALKRKMSCRSCYCPRPDTFDDMQMGMWFNRLITPATHEEGFHQAEPSNYHPSRLQYDAKAVSFHKFLKHWNGSIDVSKTVDLWREHLNDESDLWADPDAPQEL